MKTYEQRLKEKMEYEIQLIIQMMLNIIAWIDPELYKELIEEIVRIANLDFGRCLKKVTKEHHISNQKLEELIGLNKCDCSSLKNSSKDIMSMRSGPLLKIVSLPFLTPSERKELKQALNRGGEILEVIFERWPRSNNSFDDDELIKQKLINVVVSYYRDLF